jgi:hypothetical protein
MSIFDFLNKIFFGRTEKSGTYLMLFFVSIFSAKTYNGFLGFFEKNAFWTFDDPFFGHFFILKSHKAYETSHKNYAAIFLKGIFKVFLLIMMSIFLSFKFLSAKPKNLIRLMSQNAQ